MIHVRVREENDIDSGQFPDRKGRLHQPPDAQRSRSQADADSSAEHRIGQDGNAVDLQQNGAVTNPGRVQSFFGPEPGIGPVRGWPNGPAALLGILSV